MATKVEMLTEQEFQNRVVGSETPSVVDFWATWCAPCRRLDEVIEAMAQEYDGRVAFFKVDVTESTGTASRYAVWSIPTLLFFNGGEVVDQAVGALSREAIQEKLDRLLEHG
jgi:thioredoxin 1